MKHLPTPRLALGRIYVASLVLALSACGGGEESSTAGASSSSNAGGFAREAAVASASQSTLLANAKLSSNQSLISGNGKYKLTMQSDGNLVLYVVGGKALWSTGTVGTGAVSLNMQSDGNLVMRNTKGTAVWSTKTNGTGAVKAVLQDDANFVLYTSGGKAVWSSGTAVTTPDPTPTPTPTPTPNPGEGTASTGQFSSPSAALYSMNDSRTRGFPKVIDTGFGGNGHAETWDGRIFVRTRTDGWFASTFRPEKIVRNADGSVAFNQGAFGNNVTLETNAEATDMQHNWLAIIPDPAVTGQNPYPSNASGTFDVNGTHQTYKAVVYHTSLRNGDNDQMGMRKATFIVADAHTPNAQLIKADFTSSFQRFSIAGGADFRCIEPSVTIDGRLVICQGHPDNNGTIDNLVYSWNATPTVASNWRKPKSLANMYYDDRNADVAGMAFSVRYPIAERPIKDAKGVAFNAGELIKGAYPWVSHDGTELFYQASKQGVSARRTGTSVVGRWTGWTIRHIDGPINRQRHGFSRLFLSSPGAFTTMWTPYRDVDDLKIPYSVRGPSYPIFGSNTQDYSEVHFDDYLDGNYVLYLGMNEQLDRAGTYITTVTNDTSGNFNNGTLVGAKFPLEYNNQDTLVGRYGQAIYFASGNYINVARTKGWDTLTKGMTVDFWVKKMSGSGTVRLFTLAGGVEVFLTGGSTLTAAVRDTAGLRAELAGPAIGAEWTHVAFTYNPGNRQMQLYVNGQKMSERVATGFGTLQTNGTVRIGPESSTALLLLDEVKVSNVARMAYEIGHNANVRTNKAANAAQLADVPAHLSKQRFNLSGVDRFSVAAADLGRELFNDVALSRTRSTSCATCHKSSLGFTDGLAIAKGNEPTDAGVRNTSMLLNRAFSSTQGWSGNALSLDLQALVPIAAAHEMNLPIADAVARLNANSTYVSKFKTVYGEAPNANNMSAAIGSFVARQYAPKNRVDDFLAGNRSALNASEQRGMDLFNNKARCVGCHTGLNYTDESFRSNGLAINNDFGRADVTGRDRDFKLYKVPSLRSLSVTGPYMHNGNLSTLKAVVEAYNLGSLGVNNRDSDIRPLGLSTQDVSDLVAFLNAL